MTIETTQLPSIDVLLKNPRLKNLIDKWGRSSVLEGIRHVQVDLRDSNEGQTIEDVGDFYHSKVLAWLNESRQPGYRRVFNVTGTLLHSNLGRAQISDRVFDRVKDIVTRPSSLEFDLESGSRGQREAVVTERLCRLVGGEAATIVNNNAAAVFIVLHTFAIGRPVVVSRGELIEIGGSFRLPEIMEAAGSSLLEVGTTNRTHLVDYERALKHNPALLMKIHPSNYRIDGFTKSVPIQAISRLAQEANIPAVVDLGSGALVNTERFGLPREPHPGDMLNAGVDLVMFSGDKLLGGPQAGLIVGSKKLIARINANPLKRALRTSKMTLALLEETLKAHEDPETVIEAIHTIKLLSLSTRELKVRANKTQAVLAELLTSEFSVTVKSSEVQVGSGAMPGHTLPSSAVTIEGKNNRATQVLQKKLRALPIPVIGRMNRGCLELHMHGAEPLDEFIDNLTSLA